MEKTQEFFVCKKRLIIFLIFSICLALLGLDVITSDGSDYVEGSRVKVFIGGFIFALFSIASTLIVFILYLFKKPIAKTSEMDIEIGGKKALWSDIDRAENETIGLGLMPPHLINVKLTHIILKETLNNIVQKTNTGTETLSIAWFMFSKKDAEKLKNILKKHIKNFEIDK